MIFPVNGRRQSISWKSLSYRNAWTKYRLQNVSGCWTDLHEHEKQYNIHEICESLGVARGTFYNHIFRKADCLKVLEEEQELMLQVQQVFDDSQQRYGANKIRVVLAENGIHTSFNRIRRIMQELGLKSIRCNAKQELKQRQQYLKHNLLNRDFTAENPN